MKKLNIGILISGRGSNMEAIIKNIKNNYLDKVELKIVISDNENAKGLETAKKEGFDAIYLDPGTRPHKLAKENREKYIQTLKDAGVEMVVLAGFMRVISKKFIQAFHGRIINIHPSLLPAFPGLDVQQKAIDYGAKFSGCTIHFVDETVDGGPIILQEVVPILAYDDAEILSKRILEKEHTLYSKAIKLISEEKIKIEGRKVYIID